MKKNILFVGSFKDAAADRSVGGQMFACRTLVSSEITDYVNFITIDSTARSVPSPPIWQRLPFVAGRLFQLIFHLVFSRVHKVLIFTGEGTSFMEKGLMALISKYMGKKVILAPRSGLIIDDIKRDGKLKKYIKYVMNRCDKVLCQSKYWQEVFNELLNAQNDEKFVIQPNWINETTYLECTRSSYSEKMKDEPLKIIYIGWLESFKGILDLIEAIKALREFKNKIKVDIYGSGSLYEKVLGLIYKYQLSEIVTLKGWADNSTKLDALRDAHIYILPSHREGFPNALLEAMISELPAIATRVGSVPDVITDNVNGLTIPHGQPEILAENIRKLIMNPPLRLELAKNARSTVLSKYTTVKAIHNFKSLLIE